MQTEKQNNAHLPHDQLGKARQRYGKCECKHKYLHFKKHGTIYSG